MHLSLSFLGPFQAKVDDNPIPESRSKKIEALLVYLAMESQIAHRRETLVGLLFPDLPDDMARTNLRQTLTRLRRAIKDAKADPSFLLSSRETTQLNPHANVSLDVNEFERQLNGCSRHRPQLMTDCADCIGQLETAVSLYTGPFLDGFFIEDGIDFDDWILVHRERLHQQAVAAFQTVANHYEHRGEFAPAQQFAERLLEIEPWDESVQRQLLRLLAYQGKRNVALAKYETFKTRLYEELGVEPIVETRQLQQQIVAMANERPHTIPPQDQAIINREEDQATIFEQINNPETRLMTLTGPGGIGKTRLAIEVAWRTAKNFMGPFLHGTFFVPLAGISPKESAEAVKNSIIIAIAEAIGFSFSGALPPERQLINYLNDKSLFLLLDNFEHIANSGRDVVHQLLQHAPQVKLLITSRERLNLMAEWVHPIEGLPFPSEADGYENAEQYGAIQLFVYRAQQTNPYFKLTEETGSINYCSRETAVKITARLFGSPLAIELAAPWVRMMSCDEILQEIGEDFDSLTSNKHKIPPRHRSIRTVFEGSWSMLSDSEKEVAQNVSLFRGGFDRQAAKKIAAASIVDLGKLLDKSFLRQMSQMESGRYQMQELLRQYCAEKRLDSANAATLDKNHSLYYLALLQEKDSALKGDGQVDALATISQEIENIRLAWQMGLAHGLHAELDAAAQPLALYFYMRSWFTEGETLFGSAVSQVNDAGETAVLHHHLQAGQGWFTFLQGKQEEGIQLLLRSKNALDTAGDDALFATSFLAAARQITGNLEAAHALANDGLARATKVGDRYFTAVNNNILSQIAYLQGEYETARRHSETSLAIEEELGNRWSMGFSFTNLGRFAYAVGDYAQAREQYEESLAIRQAMNDTRGQALCLNYLGDTLNAEGSYQEALLKYQAALVQFQKINSQSGMASSLIRLGHTHINLNNLPLAHSHFQEALTHAQESNATPSVLSGLLGLARLNMTEAPTNSAAVAKLVYDHSAASPDSKRRADELLAQLDIDTKQIESLSIEDALLLYRSP